MSTFLLPSVSILHLPALVLWSSLPHGGDGGHGDGGAMGPWWHGVHGGHGSWLSMLPGCPCIGVDHGPMISHTLYPCHHGSMITLCG